MCFGLLNKLKQKVEIIMTSFSNAHYHSDVNFLYFHKCYKSDECILWYSDSVGPVKLTAFHLRILVCLSIRKYEV